MDLNILIFLSFGLILGILIYILFMLKNDQSSDNVGNEILQMLGKDQNLLE